MIVISASQLNRCLSLDTRVISNGIEKTIIDLQVGDLIDGETGPVTVTEILPITKQPIYEIKLKSGKTIKVSSRHKFPTNEGLLSIDSGLKIGIQLRSRTK